MTRPEQSDAPATVNCPSCGSRHPERHPAVQFEGEVEICTDEFHLTPTLQNKPEYIAQVLEKRARATGAPDKGAPTNE